VFFEGNLPPLVFDHARILQDYFAFKRTGKRPLL
jgi:8-oxo-dGTP diphosphatase